MWCMAMQTKTVTDALTGITTVEPLTPEDLTQRELDSVAIAAQEAERLEAEQAVITARASRDAKLAKMGFTLDEIANW